MASYIYIIQKLYSFWVRNDICFEIHVPPHYYPLHYFKLPCPENTQETIGTTRGVAIAYFTKLTTEPKIVIMVHFW